MKLVEKNNSKFSKKPWSEVKRSLWKEALGDEYESPSQCYNSNMQQDVSHVNDSVVSRPTGRVLSYDQPNTSGDTEVDANIKALADFINKGKEGNDRQQHHYIDLPNTAPLESGWSNRNSFNFINNSIYKTSFNCHSSIFFLPFRNDKYGTT